MHRLRFVVEFVIAAVLATGIVWAAGERMELRTQSRAPEALAAPAIVSAPAAGGASATDRLTPAGPTSLPAESGAPVDGGADEATDRLTRTNGGGNMIVSPGGTVTPGGASVWKPRVIEIIKRKMSGEPVGEIEPGGSWLDRFWTGVYLETLESGETAAHAETAATDETEKPSDEIVATPDGKPAEKPKESVSGGGSAETAGKDESKKKPVKKPVTKKPVEVPKKPPALPAVDTSKIVIGLVGDIDIPESVKSNAKNGGLDLLAGVALVRDRLNILAGSLENQLTTASKSPTVRPPEDAEERQEFAQTDEPKWAAVLAKSGFDAVSTANNHSLDFGWEGLSESLSALNNAGITPIGAGANEQTARQPRFIKVGTRTIGFLAYSTLLPAGYAAEGDEPGIAAGRGAGLTRLDFDWSERLSDEVEKARERCDFLVVSYHWGRAGATKPDVLMREIAYTLVKAGADAVYGHGPHIVQEVQLIDGVPVAFSLGDFIWHTDKASALMELVLVEKGGRLVIRTARLHECKLEDGLPVLTGSSTTLIGS